MIVVEAFSSRCDEGARGRMAFAFVLSFHLSFLTANGKWGKLVDQEWVMSHMNSRVFFAPFKPKSITAPMSWRKPSTIILGSQITNSLCTVIEMYERWSWEAWSKMSVVFLHPTLATC